MQICAGVMLMCREESLQAKQEKRLKRHLSSAVLLVVLEGASEVSVSVL